LKINELEYNTTAISANSTNNLQIQIQIQKLEDLYNKLISTKLESESSHSQDTTEVKDTELNQDHVQSNKETKPEDFMDLTESQDNNKKE